MLAGRVLLAVTAAGLGELHDFSLWTVSGKAWLSLAYLIIPGLIIGFTAYVWLIHHESPTKVGTYAYVNPVVAVLLGYFLADEELGLRTVLGTLLILVSVLVITTMRAPPAVGKRATPLAQYHRAQGGADILSARPGLVMPLQTAAQLKARRSRARW